MAVQHKNIVDPDIHEPKGASTASASTVYVADGAGSGTWKKVGATETNGDVSQKVATAITSGDVDISGRSYFTVTLNDISTASSAFVAIPVTGGIIEEVNLVLGGTITTADATVSVKRSGGGVLGSVLIPFTASAGGLLFTISAPTNNATTATSVFEVLTNGASDTVASVTATFTVRSVIN